MREAAALFSRMDDQYAFGEMDDAGKASLGTFAAQPEHRSDLQFAPTESRVYFIRTEKGNDRHAPSAQ